MSIAGGIVVFVIIWWMVLFMVLPIGVQTQHEAGEIEPGSAPSAPTAPRLLRKMLITTGIAAVLWGIFFLAMANEWISLDDFPL